MSTYDPPLTLQLNAGLLTFENRNHPLAGIIAPNRRQSFVSQLVESVHRIQYITAISRREISPLRLDPTSPLFDPIKAAILCRQQGRLEEAFWLVFISVHFGKNRRYGWQTASDVYGALGRGTLWDWTNVSNNVNRFIVWLRRNRATISSHFGNHRKYQSLSADAASGTGSAFKSYVRWIAPPRTHEMLVLDAAVRNANDPRDTFSFLYKSMNAVASFGRTARFDYLTMLGKVGLATIEAGSTYMQGATGPLQGAKLLFGVRYGNTARALDAWVVELERELGVGMQAMEDSLCNWQKSPNVFKAFRG